MMRPGRKTQKVFLYPYPVNSQKSINSLVALVEMEIEVAVFDPVMFVFINRALNQVKVLYRERNTLPQAQKA